MFHGKIHYKWQFSIAMLNYQRVINGIGMALFPLSVTLAIKQIHPRRKRLV